VAQQDDDAPGRARELRGAAGAWEAHIGEVLANLGLPAEISALPHVESSFDPYAYSKVGAAGLWQFMRSTGRRFLRIEWAAMRYLKLTVQRNRRRIRLEDGGLAFHVRLRLLFFLFDLRGGLRLGSGRLGGGGKNPAGPTLLPPAAEG